MAETDADTVVILSPELIERIVGEYFNKVMFKQKVDVVDSKATEGGYMFSVSFSDKRQRKEEEFSKLTERIIEKTVNGQRNSQGRFVKRVEV